MNYIIPVYGKVTTSPAQWRFATEVCGYHLDGYRVLCPRKNLTLTAGSTTGAVEYITMAGDDILVIDTDMPSNLVEALWAMTGTVCAFVGTTNSPVLSTDDLADAKIVSIH